MTTTTKITARDAALSALAIQLRHAIIGAYRTSTHGDLRVRLTADAGTAPTIVQTRRGVDGIYSSAWHRRHGPADVLDTTVTVGARGYRALCAAGLDSRDGLVTLTARRVRVPAHAGVAECWAATWVDEQGRGFALTATAGYIGRIGAVTYHGSSKAEALRGVIAKSAAALIAAARAEAQAEARRLEQAGAVSARWLIALRLLDSPADVTTADTAALSLCAAGVRQFCARAGIDASSGRVPVGIVAAAWAHNPTPDAYRAIRHAVARGTVSP